MLKFRDLKSNKALKAVWLLLVVWIPLTACLFFLGCRSTPVSGRKQVILVPEQQEIKMGAAAYSKILSEEKVTTNKRYAELVDRVGRRIAAVIGRDDYDWEFKVIASGEKNAFALPGGKVCVYEGLLPICRDEAGLAVVMSHEVAHVLARHGSERASHQTIASGAGKVLSVFTNDMSKESQQMWQSAYGLGAKYGAILPYSRKHELEADQIGLKLMAEAGYDPSAAVEFWERFGEAKGASGQPTFMSTHPSDAQRAESLRKLLPNALGIYKQAKRKTGLGERI